MTKLLPLETVNRQVEAVIFAAAEPLSLSDIATRLSMPLSLVRDVVGHLQQDYAVRGIHLVETANKWSFRTAPDLAEVVVRSPSTGRRPSRAAMETLVVIAYGQPVTRADIEAARGVATGRGTLDTLIEAGWIRPGQRREVLGRPLTWITTEKFLHDFTLASLKDLPDSTEMALLGLGDAKLPLTYETEPGADSGGATLVV